MPDNLPCLRLFLSVDLVGSTALKNTYNHTRTLAQFEESQKSLANLIDAKLITHTKDFNIYDPSVIQTILPNISKENFDWAEIIQEHLRDFHGAFSIKHKKIKIHASQLNPEASLWKCIGDELVYSFNIPAENHQREIRDLTCSFLDTIRSFDQRACDSIPDNGKILRVKGTGWTAGFPIRNRVLQIENIAMEDYLGPDMDIGFRLTQHTYPGFMCVSLDLAYLLSLKEGEEAYPKACIVGWMPLKGVWGNRPYPIIWIAPPRYGNGETGYMDMRPWAPFENIYAREWCNNLRANGIKELVKLNKEFKKIMEGIPQNLGIVFPYVTNDIESELMPENHKKIHKLLNSLSAGAGGKQGENDEPNSVELQEIQKKTTEIGRILTDPSSGA